MPEGKSRLGPVPPMLTFAHVPEGKTVKNRLHLDVTPTDCSQDEEIARLTGLGATVVNDNRPEFSWVTLADPRATSSTSLRTAAPDHRPHTAPDLLPVAFPRSRDHDEEPLQSWRSRPEQDQTLPTS